MSTGVWDPAWERLFSSRAWGRYPAEPVIRALARAFPDRSRPPRALDLGCGPGANTWFLAREGFRTSGIDGSAAAIAQNRARLASEGLEADLRTGDFTVELPWPAASFDAVVDAAALYANPLVSI